MDLDARARSFGSVAEDYERWRPDYPQQSLDWLLPPDARDVADVGAGTGKLTRLLVERGLHVSAVEPDPAMLAVLGRAVPRAQAHQAGADALPFADASLDAVVVGQAWHWFPHDVAASEVRRVLRPGGRLGLAWNDVRAGPGWWSEVERLDPTRGTPEPFDLGRQAPGLPLEELEVQTFDWDREVTPDDVRGCLATYSVYAVMGRAERDPLLNRAHAIAAAACREAGTATVAWPHVTLCLRWAPQAPTAGGCAQ